MDVSNEQVQQALLSLAAFAVMVRAWLRTCDSEYEIDETDDSDAYADEYEDDDGDGNFCCCCCVCCC